MPSAGPGVGPPRVSFSLNSGGSTDARRGPKTSFCAVVLQALCCLDCPVKCFVACGIGDWVLGCMLRVRKAVTGRVGRTPAPPPQSRTARRQPQATFVSFMTISEHLTFLTSLLVSLGHQAFSQTPSTTQTASASDQTTDYKVRGSCACCSTSLTIAYVGPLGDPAWRGRH